MSNTATKTTNGVAPRQIRIAPRPIAPVLSEEDWESIMTAERTLLGAAMLNSKGEVY